MKKYRLVRKDTLNEAARAASLPIAFDEVNWELLVEMMLPASGLRSRTQLRMQLEDQMAAAMERAMRGERSSFLDIYEYIPGDLQPGGIHKIHREPGPLLKEIAETHCFAPVDASDIRPQPLIVRDLRTGAVNEVLTPGGEIEIGGFDLSFDATRADEGAYLIDAIDGAEFKLVAVTSPTAGEANALRTFRATIPASLPAAHYSLEIRCRPCGVDLRVGTHPNQLHV